MPPIVDLDDEQETSFFIPFVETSDEEHQPVGNLDAFTCSYDLPGGRDLRTKAYKTAWSKCLKRVQDVAHSSRAPLVREVVGEIRDAYSCPLPGLPYDELPIFTVSAQSGGASLLTNVIRQLSGSPVDDIAKGQDAASTGFDDAAFVTQLFPSDCSSVMSCMKALIAGFVTKPTGNDGGGKRKPGTSLATYDAQLLVTWYQAIVEKRDTRPNLVMVVHDFEQIDAAILQDVFYICSLHIPALPVVFILSTSAPSPSTYMQSSFSRSTMSLLRVRHFIVPSGIAILHEILSKTFFNPAFEPDVMLGPATLDAIIDRFSAHDSSVDGLVAMLQLAHMKHFEEPLTFLVHNELAGAPSQAEVDTLLSQPSSLPFVDALLARAHAPELVSPPVDHADRWRSLTVATLPAAVACARGDFRTRVHRTRMAWLCMGLVQRWMVTHGYRSADPSGGSPDVTGLERMSRVLNGKAGRDARYLGMMVKKLTADKLALLLEDLPVALSETPSCLHEDDETFVISLEEFATSLALLGEHVEQPVDKADEQQTRARHPDIIAIAENTGTLITEYLEERLTPLDGDDVVLWEVWYMGQTPFPVELVNPAPRASVVAALLYPTEYMRSSGPGARSNSSKTDADDSSIPYQESDGGTERRQRLWELPDISILFTRYLEAGKMLNAYDWFESFGQVLDTQRRKRRGAEEMEDEEKEEKWKLEVQARFIRALHELDFLGFIKHTGRKADHVIRTVYDFIG